MELTEQERERVRILSKAPSKQTQLRDIDPDGDDPLSFPWRLDDDRAGVTLETCNAVRAAADDGLAYRDIAALFDALADGTHARRHAVGECRHSGGLPPTATDNAPGPPSGRIPARVCSRLRRRWRRGQFDTYADAAAWADIGCSAAYRHINGECRHE